MKDNRISYKLERAEYKLEQYENLATFFKGDNVQDLLDLSAGQLKIFLAMASFAKHNIVEMTDDKYEKIISMVNTVQTNRSIDNALSKLVKDGILIRPKKNKIYLIDLSYLEIGDHNKIFQYHECVRKGENLEELYRKNLSKQRSNYHMDVLQGKIDSKRNSEEQVNIELEAKQRFGKS